MKKIYDFDTIVERKNTNCIKEDHCKAVFGTDDLIPLWIADMDFKTPDFILDALRERLNHEILGYSVRPEAFFRSLQAWVKRRNNWETKIEHMTFSPGIVAAINLSILAYTKPGDRVLISSPVYHPFMFAINDHKRELVKSSLVMEHGRYTIDFVDFETQLSSGVKMLILCSPHNPVGRVWTREELQKIAALCLKYDVLVIADEIHSDLIFAPHKHIHFASLSDEIAARTVTFLAPSKTFNLAGVSTSIVHASNQTLLAQFNEQINILHITLGNIFGDVALETAYTKGDNWLDQLLVYVEGNFDFIIDYLDKNIPQIKVIKPEGTYLMWFDFNSLNMSQKDLVQFIQTKAGLALNSGVIFGDEGKGFMRLNAACPRVILEKAMHQLNQAISVL